MRGWRGSIWLVKDLIGEWVTEIQQIQAEEVEDEWCMENFVFERSEVSLVTMARYPR